MTSVKAVVRNGRIEVDQPLDLPDGTELTILIPEADGPGMRDDDWSARPDAIEAWIRWYDALEPVVWTREERAAWEAARHDQKQFEKAQWEDRSRRLEEHFS